MEESTIQAEIKKLIQENNVILFMKGVPEAPQCGFSASVVRMLQTLNVDFKGINVLANEAMRSGIKEFSDWPTIPQLYVKQEFIGGCDIVTEMYQQNELQELFKQHGLLSA